MNAWKSSEENVEKFIHSLPNKQSGVALDIGANIRRYTDKLASKFGLVYAFEPHPDTISLLRKNLKARNVITMPYAVADIDGYIPLYISSNSSCHTTMGKDSHLDAWGFSKANKISVPAITLNTLYNDLQVFDRHDKVKFIKCDAEGAEDTLFYSADKLLTNNKIDIILEVHTDVDHDRLYYFFSFLGYKIFSLDTKKQLMSFGDGMHFLITNKVER